MVIIDSIISVIIVVDVIVVDNTFTVVASVVAMPFLVLFLVNLRTFFYFARISV